MKNFKFLALSLVFLLITVAQTMACFGWDWGSGGGNGGGGGGDVVGAPLDGGLLAILAAAGITYFAARKRKKNKQE